MLIKNVQINPKNATRIIEHMLSAWAFHYNGQLTLVENDETPSNDALLELDVIRAKELDAFFTKKDKIEQSKKEEL